MLEIVNLTQRALNQELFEKIAKKILEEEGQKGEIVLIFVGPGRIKKMNYKYRGKNKVTDVLSFPASQNQFPFPPGAPRQLGEIYLCPRVVKKIAKREGSDFEKELARTFIHGVLHLLGYDHQKPKEAKIMEEKEIKYLNYFFKP